MLLIKIKNTQKEFVKKVKLKNQKVEIKNWGEYKDLYV